MNLRICEMKDTSISLRQIADQQYYYDNEFDKNTLETSLTKTLEWIEGNQLAELDEFRDKK